MAEQKTFEYYEQLLPEIRAEIIDEMQPGDRCRFTRCSHRSQIEAKKSKNYIYGLTLESLFVSDAQRWVISIQHMEQFYGNTDPIGYDLIFIEEGAQKYIGYRNGYGPELHRTELNTDTDIVGKAFEEFKKLLQIYQNNIRSLTLSNSNSYDFGITKLSNLEVLHLNLNSEVLPFLQMTKKPLRWLYFQDTDHHEEITGGEQIYQVQDRLEACWLKINYEQFKRLIARDIYVSVSGLTANDVYDFIKSWKTGTIRKTFRYCWWHLETWEFDKHELFRLLELEYNGTREKTFGIKHDTVVGRYAQLVYTRNPHCLTFSVPPVQIHQAS